MQRSIGFRLHDFDQSFAQQLQDGDEGDGHAAAPLLRPEQPHEIHERALVQRRQHVGHALPHRQRLALHVMVGKHVAARQHVLKGEQHFLQRDLRRDAHDLAVDELRGCHPGVALQPRHAVDAFGGALEALVFLQTAHQLGARIRLIGRIGARAAAAAACAT